MKYAGFIRIFLLKETTKVRSARNYEVKQFDEMNSFSISVGFLLSFFSFFFSSDHRKKREKNTRQARNSRKER